MSHRRRMKIKSSGVFCGRYHLSICTNWMSTCLYQHDSFTLRKLLQAGRGELQKNNSNGYDEVGITNSLLHVCDV